MKACNFWPWSGGTESASRFCPGGHNPLADSVRGDNNWGGGGTKSAMTPGSDVLLSKSNSTLA